MRKKPFYSYAVGMLLFCAGTMISSCQRDANSVLTDGSKNEQVSQNTENPCTTCNDFDLFKTPSTAEEQVGTLQVCQPSPTEITFTFTISETRENAWFTQTGIAIDVNGENFAVLNPSFIERENTEGEKLRQVTYTVDYTTLTKDVAGVPTPLAPGDQICVAAYAVVPGPDGAGGQVWAGTVPTTSGNPHPRSFCYVIKECQTQEPPTANCTFTQGYWFAKPGGWKSGKGKTKIPAGYHWPGSLEINGIEFGNDVYTYAEARAIFFGSNKKTGKTDAKQAFLQGLALKLSMVGNEGIEPCPGTLAALELIEDYFAAVDASRTQPFEQTASSINSYPANADLRAAAGLISDCLNESHCDNTPIPAGQ